MMLDGGSNSDTSTCGGLTNDGEKGRKMAESRWEAEQRRRDAKARIARFDEADWQARRRRAERAEGTRRAALALIFAGPSSQCSTVASGHSFSTTVTARTIWCSTPDAVVARGQSATIGQVRVLITPRLIAPD